MNVKRFVARTSRDALNLVRQALGDEAVVLSTKPCNEGVEILAMAGDSVGELERVLAPQPGPRSLSERAAAQLMQEDPAPGYQQAQAALEQTHPGQDAERLAMSTLSFQDYVRERMLRRRKAELAGEPVPPLPAPSRKPASGAGAPQTRRADSRRPEASNGQPGGVEPRGMRARTEEGVRSSPLSNSSPSSPSDAGTGPSAPRRVPAVGPMLQAAEDEIEQSRETGFAPLVQAGAGMQAADARPMGEMQHARQERTEMMSELRSMKGLIEERFSTLAFMEKLQRQPGRATLSQKLLDCGFSPGLVRKLVDKLPEDVDATAWATGVLERNLATGERDAALEDEGGVYALVGATGVGKTTSTAKLAAAFATRHGAANLGLITLDAYRVGAHEQLRAYGRILGVPVHIAHDRASLEDLLELLSNKRLVLIDTAGMAQRDTRTRELLQMLSHPSIRKLLVVNAAAQGETIEDVLMSYRAAQCHGVVLSKLDEAVKIGPALDAMIRHRLKVLAVGNGQRVPEDWHRLSAATLVQRALCVVGSSAWRLDSTDVNLVLAGPAMQAAANPVATSVRTRAAEGLR